MSQVLDTPTNLYARPGTETFLQVQAVSTDEGNADSGANIAFVVGTTTSRKALLDLLNHLPARYDNEDYRIEVLHVVKTVTVEGNRVLTNTVVTMLNGDDV